MCGLVGSFGTQQNNNTKGYLEDGISVGVLRGVDSTGMFQLSKKDKIAIHKLAVHGAMFAESKRAKSLLSDVFTSKATIVHHRAATRGGVSVDTAHPFLHTYEGRSLVGVHNGTIHNARTKMDDLEFEVDSDYCLYRILKEGNDAFADFDGAFAFVYAISGEDGLRVAVNGKRPFSVGFVRKSNTALIATEAAMLYWLADRNNLVLDDIIIPDDHTVTYFPYDDVRNYTIEDIKEFKARPAVPASTSPKQLAGPTTRKTSGSTTSCNTGTSTEILITTGEVISSAGGTSARGGSLTELGLIPREEVEFVPRARDCVDNYRVIGTVAWDGPDGKLITHPGILEQVPDYLMEQAKAGNLALCLAKVSYSYTHNDRHGKQHYIAVNEPSLAQLNSDLNRAGSILGEDAPGWDDDPADILEWSALEEGEFKTGNLIGPNGKGLTLEEFELVARDGCINCHEYISKSEAFAGMYTFVNNGQDICCADCSKKIAA